MEIWRILCPVDYSEHSRRAVDYACAIARWYRATVTGLYVLEPMSPLPARASEGLDPPFVFTQRHVERFQAQLEAFMRDCAGNRAVEAMVVEGAVSRDIVRVAREMPADLIVMGTHGRSGVDRLMLGSTTEKLLRRTPCPLLTVPAHAPDAVPVPVLFRRILCAVDFSPSSLRALTFAESLAEEADARLCVIHIVEPPSVFEPVPMGAAGGAITAEERRAGARRRLAGVISRDARIYSHVSEVVTSGKPYRDILREAVDQGSDLIVMGAHAGMPGVPAFGSTTNHVVREAACPVLTVRH
jgi:nucleotide-binding universal stress UspA family protein